MAAGKLVVLTSGMEPVMWDLFMSQKPAGWEVTTVNPEEGEQKVIKELADAEYVFTMSIGRFSPKLLESAKKLKLIQAMTQGTEHLPVKEAIERNIPVCNTGGANAMAVAEFTVMLMLAVTRKLLVLNQSLKEGKFRGNVGRKETHTLYNQTVGILGFGNIGRRVAKICYDGFGTNILYSERMFIPYALRADMHARPVSIDELFAQSDILTIHIPSMASTKGMIGWKELSQMKPTACLINTSRGAVLDEKALIRALQEKKIAGAGIDVWDPEPPNPDNPLLHMPNVVATPHSAGPAWEIWQPSFEVMWTNAVLVSQGKPPLGQVREF
jgi:phosphoglycerate dehydrogenase-like enzyme